MSDSNAERLLSSPEVRPQLLGLIVITPTLLAYLNDIITTAEKQELSNHFITNMVRVDQLLEIIGREGSRAVHALVKALKAEKQMKAVSLLTQDGGAIRSLPPRYKSNADLQNEELLKLVNKHEPVLLRRMTVDIMFLSVMMVDNVLDECKRDSIMSKTVNHERVAELMDHIRRDVQSRFNPFLKALYETDQGRMAEIVTKGLPLNKHNLVDMVEDTWPAPSAPPAPEYPAPGVGTAVMTEAMVEQLLQSDAARTTLPKSIEITEELLQHLTEFLREKDRTILLMESMEMRERVSRLLRIIEREGVDAYLMFEGALQAEKQRRALRILTEEKAKLTSGGRR